MNNKCKEKDAAERTKKKAYELWEKDGRRQSCDLHYWLKAEKAVKAQIKK